MNHAYQGSLFIVAAPSGGGKTSLVKKLINILHNIEVSISHTTREKRPAEVHGADYFFIQEAAFREMINAGEFIEHAQVFNHLYGTSRSQIDERLQKGIDIVLDIDWQGAQQIKSMFSNAVSIFVVPPSLEELKLRLVGRRQDNDEIVASRMRKAQDELSHYAEFDYLIVNDDFDKAAVELKSIVVTTRLRMDKQIKKEEKLLSFLLTSQ
jgi:guanylate kinase